jgi:hypothetical protein
MLIKTRKKRKIKAKRTRGMVQVQGHLSSKLEALSSNTSTAKKR